MKLTRRGRIVAVVAVLLAGFLVGLSGCGGQSSSVSLNLSAAGLPHIDKGHLYRMVELQHLLASSGRVQS
jgi:hypothetical protein